MSVILYLTTALLLWLGIKLRGHLLGGPRNKQPGLPPSPGLSLPVLGHLYLLEPNPRKQFLRWGRRLGPVFSLNLGGRLAVVMSGYDTLKEALVKHADVFSDRPRTFVMQALGKDRGFVTSGPDWRAQRKVAIEILGRLGLGTSVMEDKVQREIGRYLDHIDHMKGQPFDPRQLTMQTISDVISSLLFGSGFSQQHPDLARCASLFGDQVSLLEGTVVLNFLPVLRIIPGDPFGFHKVLKLTEQIEDGLIKQQIELRKQSMNQDELRKQSMNQDELRKQPMNQDELRKQSMNQDELRKKSRNQDELRKQSMNQDELRKQSMNQDELLKQSINQDELRKQSMNQDELRKQSMNQGELHKQSMNQDELRKQSMNQDELRMQSMNQDEHKQGRDFVTCYLKEIEAQKRTGVENSPINEENLVAVVANFFAAGTETTSTTICWALLYLLHHSDVLERCFQEIVATVGLERRPRFQDRQRMKYLEATIMEVQRISSITPFSLHHTASRDVVFKNFLIPKGTIIMPSLDSVLLSEQIWGDPDTFRPERFLDPISGNIVKREELIPFSIGRRSCLGEALAKMELFLFLSSIIQRYHVIPAQNAPLPLLRDRFGLSCSPLPYQISLVPRETPKVYKIK